MRRAVTIVSLLVMTSAMAAPVLATATVVAPPAIYVPAGGKVVTEINVSDDDVLGIIKQAIPAAGDIVKEMAGQEGGAGGNAKMAVAMAGMVDLKELSEAIEGIKNIRLLVVRYSQPITPERFVNEFTAGAAKAGQFNKIASDFGFFPGALGIYALPGNAGCMGFAYIPAQRTAYAVRIVGGVDVPKLIKWAGNIAKMAVGQRGKAKVEEQPEDATQPASPAEPAEPPAAVEEK